MLQSEPTKNSLRRLPTAVLNFCFCWMISSITTLWGRLILLISCSWCLWAAGPAEAGRLTREATLTMTTKERDATMQRNETAKRRRARSGRSMSVVYAWRILRKPTVLFSGLTQKQKGHAARAVKDRLAMLRRIRDHPGGPCSMATLQDGYVENGRAEVEVARRECESVCQAFLLLVCLTAGCLRCTRCVPTSTPSGVCGFKHFNKIIIALIILYNNLYNFILSFYIRN